MLDTRLPELGDGLDADMERERGRYTGSAAQTPGIVLGIQMLLPVTIKGPRQAPLWGGKMTHWVLNML